MTSKQLLLDLPIRTARGRDDFFVAPSNELAVKKIDDYQNWAGGKLVLAGPKGSGKSHLVGVWSDLTKASIVELNVEPDVIKFLITRIDRSFAEAERVVAMLDEASMVQRKPITVRFAGGLLKSQS